MAHRYNFPKEEHLCGDIRTGKLFQNGKGFIAYPLRVVYLWTEDDEADATVRVLISVPKKKIRKAVHRNRIKRLIREAYRLNKSVIVEKAAPSGKHLHLGFIYLATEDPGFSTIKSAMEQSLNKIQGYPANKEQSDV